MAKSVKSTKSVKRATRTTKAAKAAPKGAHRSYHADGKIKVLVSLDTYREGSNLHEYLSKAKNGMRVSDYLKKVGGYRRALGKLVRRGAVSVA